MIDWIVHTPVRYWYRVQVAAFLQYLNITDCAEAVEEHEIDGQMLADPGTQVLIPRESEHPCHYAG